MNGYHEQLRGWRCYEAIEIGVSLKVQCLIVLLALRVNRLSNPQNGCGGRLVKILLIVGTIIHHERDPVVFYDILVFPRGTPRGDNEMSQIPRIGKVHEV